MKHLVVIYYASILVITLGFLIFYAKPPHRPTAAECSISEISPDMSPRDKEVCRQMRQMRHRM